MRCLVLSAAPARGDRLAATLRAEGYDVEVRIGPVKPDAELAPSAAAIVFVELALGVDAIRELCLPLLKSTPRFPPLIAVVGEPIALDEVDALIAAGVNVYVGNESDGLAGRARFIRHSVEKRAQLVAHAHASEERYRSELAARCRAEEDSIARLERGPDAVCFHRDGRILWANEKGAKILGYDDARALVGLPILQFASPRYRAVVSERVRLLAEGHAVPPLEHTLRRKDGEDVHVVVFSIPTLYGGEPALLSILRDLTEQRRLEMQLVVADRQAVLGRLATSVGHEINNPLAYVIGNLRAAAERLRAGGEAGRSLQLIDEAVEGSERIGRIVRDLKVFAAGERPEELAPVDVHRVIDACARMADNEIRHRARLVRDFADVPPVRANEPRLAQVLLNLLVNAAQAIPEGDSDAHTITVSTRLEADAKVAVCVRDTGVGIAKENLQHVFEPFFTSKTDAGGTGLGLSICQMLVAAQGGAIAVQSDEGRGTSVTVRLSAAEGAPDSVAAAPASVRLRARRRVLLVDDEVRLARLVCESLSVHDVTLATSGREALACIAGSAPFDVIVCDLMMPDLTGMDVYDHVQRLVPGLERRMVFITGGAFTPRAIRFLADRAKMRLEKPFLMNDLLAAIDRAAGV